MKDWSMQHPMRRKKQQLDRSAAAQIMEQGSFGVLALADSQGEPYAVPLNYVYLERGLDPAWEGPSIYFHAAKVGHKLELLKENPRASFCVVAESEVLPDVFATAYRSTIAFGPVHILRGEGEEGVSAAEVEMFYQALYALGDKYNPGADAAIEHEIASDGPHCIVLELRVEILTGKVAKSLLA